MSAKSLLRSRVLSIDPTVDTLAEDKDYARDLRRGKILPALEAGGRVTLDFARATYVTQSFVHALVGEALKRYGEDVLDRIEFKSCSPQVKSIVELVVDYSLGGFSPALPKEAAALASAKHPKRAPSRKNRLRHS